MATYLADRVVVYSGQPAVHATAHTPQALVTGMNAFLKDLEITFRRDPTNYRPRINKLASLKDKEQKSAGTYFYIDEDADDDDAEPAAEDLATITNGGAAGYGAQVGDDLRHGDGVGGEEILVGQQGWVQVLAAVGHKVEASHHQDEVDEQNPVFSECDFAFRDEGSGNITLALANGDTALESLGFWQA